MTSQTGSQTITIHTLQNISQGKGNQTMKFGQVQNISRGIFNFKKHAENEAEILVSDFSLFFEKAFYELKLSGLGMQ